MNLDAALRITASTAGVEKVQQLQGALKGVGTQAGAVQKPLGGAGAAATTASKGFGQLRGAAAVAGSALLSAGLVQGLQSVMMTYSDFQTETLLLQKGLENLNVSNPVQELERLQKVASDLGEATLFNEEDFRKGFGMLTSFTSIAVKDYDRLATVAADVAQTMGTDIRQVFVQLGKALNDPVKGVTALADSGIQFTDAQREMIKSMVETNNIAGAQELIFKELERQYGGNAVAAAGGMAGAMDTLGEKLYDLRVALGPVIEAGLVPLVQALTQIVNFIAGTLLPLFSALPQPIQVVVSLFTALSLALAAILPVAGLIMSALAPLAPLFAGIGGALGGVAAAVAGWAGAVVPALGAIGSAFTTLLSIITGVLTGPVGWVVLIAAAVAALIAFREPIGQFFSWIGKAFSDWIASLWEWGTPIREFWIGLWDSIRELAGGFFTWLAQGLYDWLVQPWLTVGSAIVSAVAAVWEQVKEPVLGFFAWWGTTLYQLLLEPWVLVWSKLTEAAQGIWSQLQSAAGAFWAWFSSSVNQYIAQPFQQAAAAVLNVMGGVWSGIKSAASSFWGWIGQQVDQYIVGPFTVARDVVVGIWSELANLIGQTWAGISGLFSQYVVDPIKGAWQALQDWMVGIVQGAANAVKGAYEAIAGGILWAFRGIVGAVNNVINSVINAINTLISGVNNIRNAVGLSSIGLVRNVNIPSFADGGFVQRPTLALVGEGGEPEYIVPSSKMGAAAANYLSGSRGDAVLNAAPQLASVSQSQPVAAAPGAAQINITTGPVMELDGRRWVSLDDLQSAVKQTQAQIYATLRTPAGRRAIGVA